MTAMPTKGFFDLPGELRNQIYMGFLHEDGDASYHPGMRELKLVGPSARVCTRFREECSSLSILHARVVHCKVSRFDFGPLITFLNTLGDTSLAAVLQHSANVQPQTTIADSTLLPWTDRNNLIHLDAYKPNAANLRRWLKRFEVPEKEDTALNFRYVVSKDTETCLTALSMCESMLNLGCWEFLSGEGHHTHSYRPTRQDRELLKIIHAFKLHAGIAWRA